ncbi:MAG TPA: hypothetical protein VMR34_06275 [Candidatus Saccharimonadales bacterium]|nr:hypothetical protein [Candidatus Saccharimonadales bacterium]
MTTSQTDLIPKPEIEPEELLLADIDPVVIEVLGQDTVLHIENVIAVMSWIDQLVASKNPFDRTRTIPDLSFLSDKDKERLDHVLDANQSDYIRKGYNSTLEIGRTEKVFSKVFEGVTERGDQATDSISTVLDMIESKNKRRHASLDSPEAVEGELDLDELYGLFTKLELAAEILPGDAEIKVLKATLDLRDRILRMKRGSRFYEKAVPMMATGMRQDKDTVARLKTIHTAARSFGKKTHSALISAANTDQVVIGEALIPFMASLKQNLEQAAEEEPESLPSGFAATEAYLGSKAQAVEAFSKKSKGSGEGFGNPKQLEFLLGLHIAKTELDRQRQQEVETSKDFNREVTEARDIVKGGRRLKYDRKDIDLPALADSLNDIPENGGDNKLLSIEERGLILSIITNKFDSFVQTLSRMNSSEVDNVRVFVKSERPDIFSLLADFDLEDTVFNLLILLEDDEGVKKLSRFLSDEQIKAIKTSLTNYLGLQERQNHETPDGSVLEEMVPLNEQYAELDWTVLPESESELQKAAQEIVTNAQERGIGSGREVTIDLERLNILKNIKEQWGADRCFYARGSLDGRRKVTVDGQDRPDEYIVLVLQELDREGGVVYEHAIAESPIAGHNALYVLRGDVTPFSWREVYSYPKKDARYLGARQVKHTKVEGSELVESMTEKVGYLMAANPEDFSKIRFSSGRIVIPKS